MAMNFSAAASELRSLGPESTLVLTAALVCIIALSASVVALSALLVIRRRRVDEFDSVTGIPAYKAFERAVRRRLEGAAPNEHIILSFNVENFRYVNESCGIVKGNEILRILARHFQRQCAEGEYVCRFYADNFVFFMRTPEFFWSIEERVFEMTDVDSLFRGMLPEKYGMTFCTSVFYIDDATIPVELMIDKANLAQKLCRDTFATHRVIEYTKEMKETHDWSREATLTMEKAIENREFEVYYQPKFLFRTGEVVGAEALIRWNNPSKGFLPPGKFVPLFESNGFIEKIDIYVLEQVCRFLASWNSESPGARPLSISFNLSRCHLYNPMLIKEMKRIVEGHDIGGNRIEVELTESVMFDNHQKLIKVMNDIKSAGFSVSVDDFGSGYSSLNLLKNMPADVIKLDKEFISSVPENNKESIIITSIIEMAKKLNITTVAEGVETQTQRDLLRDFGCDIAQGFYYAKPMPEAEFKNMLQNSKKDL